MTNIPAVCCCGPRECLHPANLRAGVTCKVQASETDFHALVEQRDRALEERDTYRTLAAIGAWHKDCRPNREMAAREIQKSQAVINKLADTITALTIERDDAWKIAAEWRDKLATKIAQERAVDEASSFPARLTRWWRARWSGSAIEDPYIGTPTEKLRDTESQLIAVRGERDRLRQTLDGEQHCEICAPQEQRMQGYRCSAHQG